MNVASAVIVGVLFVLAGLAVWRNIRKGASCSCGNCGGCTCTCGGARGSRSCAAPGGECTSHEK
ncbi:MAG: hypothetical protein IJL17_17810 [Kiritimatiellae bacterium]|nr:hypothetical protein [Kiritimatiellia bacterium]